MVQELWELGTLEPKDYGTLGFIVGVGGGSWSQCYDDWFWV